MQKELVLKSFEDLNRAVYLLKDSLDSYKPYEPSKEYLPKEMEYYDSLSFRFEKSVELSLHFLKTLEIYLFGEQSDTLRTRLLRLQRANYIDSVEFWISARILRNKIAHAYLPEELKNIYSDVVKLGGEIVSKVKSWEKKIRNLP